MIKNTYIKLSDRKKKTIALFSDLHFCKHYPKKRLDAVYKSIVKHRPNYICIAGDLLDQANVLEDETCKKEMLTWLDQVSKIAKTIIVLGNHDVTMKIKNKRQYHFPKELVEGIQKLPNVVLLNNTSIVLDSICFLGYTPSYTYYTRKPLEQIIDEEKDLDCKLEPSLYKGDTILLCHTPIYVTHPKVLQTRVMQQVDLVLAGHMHNGALPFSFFGNRGLIGPSKKWFPAYARGKFTLQKITYVVSGGVIAFSAISPKFFHPFNAIYPVHVEYITL